MFFSQVFLLLRKRRGQKFKKNRDGRQQFFVTDRRKKAKTKMTAKKSLRAYVFFGLDPQPNKRLLPSAPVNKEERRG